MTDPDRRPPRDTNGTLALVSAAGILVFAPLGIVLTLVFASRSRRALGYRSARTWIALVAAWVAIAAFAVFVALLWAFSRTNLTF